VIDTHAHLDLLDDPAAAIARAKAVGVERIVAIGSGVDSARAARAIAAGQDGVYVAAGLHPHDASSDVDLAALVGDDVVAIGEIGLDFFRDYAPRDDQRRVFSAQLDLAAELGKPVIIHTRAADEETLEQLARFRGQVVLHCFSEPGLLPVALDRDYYVSFAGNVTYRQADALRDAARQVPPDRILAETDSPFLAPQPVRGRPNEPAYVLHTLTALAEVRRTDPAELARQIDENASAVFGLA
jgi:TatD DNase family protein